jgi:hypothetical protein
MEKERKCKISVAAFNEIFPMDLIQHMTPEEAHIVSLVELKVKSDTIVSTEELDKLLTIIKNVEERLNNLIYN